jgi:hypothetical protein
VSRPAIISTGIVLNIAEGNGRFSVVDHAKFLGIAHKATVQSAALLESGLAGNPATANQLSEGLAMLRRIAILITGLSQSISGHG